MYEEMKIICVQEKLQSFSRKYIYRNLRDFNFIYSVKHLQERGIFDVIRYFAKLT